MPSNSLVTSRHRPCGDYRPAQLSSARNSLSTSLQRVRAGCSSPGWHSTASCHSSGAGHRCKQGWGAGTCCLLGRPLFGPCSHGVATSAAQQPGSGGSSSSSRPAQPCPLHACLLRHGISDLAAFSAPRHLALSQEEVISNVQPKLAALAAEGLSPKQVAELMGQEPNSAMACSYQDTFQPNMQLLQQIALHIPQRTGPKSHLTAVGKRLTASPITAARFLSRDPSKVQQLLQWLEGSLGVGLKQLAGCQHLCLAPTLSARAASAVYLSLQQQQVSARQVAFLLIKQPAMLGLKPEGLSARVALLQQHLILDTAAALQVAMAHPRLLTFRLEASLPPLLRFLDGYMGEEGAGRRLVCAQPSTATLTVKVAQRCARQLEAMGYCQHWIQDRIRKQPTLLGLDLASPLQQQKLGWIERVSPWLLDDFLDSPRYFETRTRRLAARRALLQECRLQLPLTPASLTTSSNSCFVASVTSSYESRGGSCPGPAGQSGRRRGWAQKRAGSGASRPQGMTWDRAWLPFLAW